MPADRLAARKAVALLAVVVLMVVAAFTLGSSAAVADTGSLPGTGVAAFDLADGDAVGPAVAIGPGEGRETVDSCSTSALGCCVATRAPGGGGGTTRVYRVEGPGNTRLNVTPSGNVTAKGGNMLFLNFGDEARAQQFLGQRVGQGHVDDVIKSFDVPTSFLDDVRAASVPQQLGRSHRAPLSSSTRRRRPISTACRPVGSRG